MNGGLIEIVPSLGVVFGIGAIACAACGGITPSASVLTSRCDHPDANAPNAQQSLYQGEGSGTGARSEAGEGRRGRWVRGAGSKGGAGTEQGGGGLLAM